MNAEKKLSLSYRIDSISPSHVHFTVFSNMVLEEYEHVQVTRTRCGELVLSTSEMGPFLERTKPHIITFREGLTQCIKFNSYCNLTIEEGVYYVEY